MRELAATNVVAPSGVQLVLAAAVVVLGAVLLTLPFHDVTRARVARFASRQRLPITADNGQLVISYLATTRRWRGCGMIVTVAGSILALVIKLVPTVQFNTFTLVVGWFLGAVIAEWRISARASDATRRTASLTRRTASDYVTDQARWAAYVVLAAALVVEAVAVAARKNVPVAIALLTITAAATVALHLVSRRILTRGQPDAAVDVLAADEAIRSRSLNVLFGCAVALSSWFGYLAASLLFHGTDATRLLQVLSLIALGVGTVIAIRPPMLPRRGELTTARSTGM